MLHTNPEDTKEFKGPTGHQVSPDDPYIRPWREERNNTQATMPRRWSISSRRPPN
jgi:hypothetical protein